MNNPIPVPFSRPSFNQRIRTLILENNQAAWLSDQLFERLLEELCTGEGVPKFDLALLLVIVQRLERIEAALDKIATVGLEVHSSEPLP